MLLQVYMEIGGSAEDRDPTIGSEKPECSLNLASKTGKKTHKRFLVLNMRDRHQTDLHLLDMRE